MRGVGILSTALTIASVAGAAAILILQRRAYRLARAHRDWVIEHSRLHKEDRELSDGIAESVAEHVQMHRAQRLHREQAGKADLN
jgi:hypothetical protein